MSPRPSLNPEPVTPGEVNPWYFLGALSHTIETKGRITVADWNGSVQIAAEAKAAEAAALAERRAAGA